MERVRERSCLGQWGKKPNKQIRQFHWNTWLLQTLTSIFSTVVLSFYVVEDFLAVYSSCPSKVTQLCKSFRLATYWIQTEFNNWIDRQDMVFDSLVLLIVTSQTTYHQNLSARDVKVIDDVLISGCGRFITKRHVEAGLQAMNLTAIPIELQLFQEERSWCVSAIIAFQLLPLDRPVGHQEEDSVLSFLTLMCQKNQIPKEY